MVKNNQISTVFILHRFLPESYGGAEKSSLRIARDLKNKNVNAIILAPKLKKETPSENFEKNILVKRFKVKHEPNLGGKKIFSFIFWSIKLIYWLFKNSKKFDIVHIIHGRLHALPAIFAAKVLNKPIILKLGRGGSKYFDLNVVRKKKIFGFFYHRYIQKNVTAWIANSKIIVNDLKKHNIRDENIYKIYNGIDIKEIRVNKFRSNKNFIVIGRLDEEKCCDQIINVFSKIPENFNVKLHFLGDGSQEEYLKELSKKLNQSHRIFFKGPIANVNKEIIKADYYISASISEGMSNSLLESMSLGVPGLVSNVSGIDEIVINNKNGFIFEMGDEKSLYKQIINAINFSEADYFNLSRSASEHIIKNFSIDQISAKYIELYSNLLKRN